MNTVFLAVESAKNAIYEYNKVELERYLKEYDLSAYHRDLFNIVIICDFVSAVSCFVPYINIPFTSSMYCALHVAKSREMIKELVRLGARLDVRSVEGFTPLHTAHNTEVVEELLCYGMDVNVCDWKCFPPLLRYIQLHREISFIVWFVENCNPCIPYYMQDDFKLYRLYPIVNDFQQTLPQIASYFQQTLPQRHAHCVKVVLLLIGAKAFRYKDVTLMIVRLVWKTRRNPCWDLKKMKNK